VPPRSCCSSAAEEISGRVGTSALVDRSFAGAASSSKRERLRRAPLGRPRTPTPHRPRLLDAVAELATATTPTAASPASAVVRPAASAVLSDLVHSGCLLDADRHFRFPPLTALADAEPSTAEQARRGFHGRFSFAWQSMTLIADDFATAVGVPSRRDSASGQGGCFPLRIRQCRSAGPDVADVSVPECERPAGLAEDRAQQRSLASCSFSTPRD